ncbi:MAG: hypothetical protein AB7U82_07680 [Blastocatellales bacterium]
MKNTALVLRLHWDANLHHLHVKKAEGQRLSWRLSDHDELIDFQHR